MNMQCNPLRWRHNGRDSVSNHQPQHCLLNRLFRRRSKKTSKLRVTGLCVVNSPVAGDVPAQMASNAENVSIWWRHHALAYMSLHVWFITCRPTMRCTTSSVWYSSKLQERPGRLGKGYFQRAPMPIRGSFVPSLLRASLRIVSLALFALMALSIPRYEVESEDVPMTRPDSHPSRIPNSRSLQCERKFVLLSVRHWRSLQWRHSIKTKLALVPGKQIT